MLPYTTKFLSNGAIVDSVGSKEQTYISVYNTETYTYYLRNTAGVVERYNTQTEEISTAYVNIPSYKKRVTQGKVKIVTDKNYPVYSVVEKNGAVYAFTGYKARKFDNDTVFFIADNDKIISEKFNRSSKTTILSSSTGIHDFFIFDDKSYCVIHANNQLSKFSKERELIYSFKVESNIEALSAVGISSVSKLLAVDFVREYSDKGVRSYPILLGSMSDDRLFLAKVDETLPTITFAKVLPIYSQYYKFGDDRKLNYNLTNYEYLRRESKFTGQLMFKLKLINLYNNRDTLNVKIPFDVTKLTSGYHHFAFRVDAVDGFVCLFVDGVEISRVSIPSSKYTFQNISQESLYVGTTYFYNNIPLFKFLKQDNFYFVDKCKVKQFKIYDRALNDNEIRFLTYSGQHVEDLVTSFPSDQRSGIDEIERQFTLDVNGNKSNSINILIKNSTITNPTVQNYIKDTVVERLKKVLPATTRIENITFRDNTYTA